MMVTDEIDRGLVVEAVRMVRAKGLRTAIVTNNIREYGDAWRGQFPLDELFDAVVDSCEEGVRKPDPTIFRMALQRGRGRRPDPRHLPRRLPRQHRRRPRHGHARHPRRSGPHPRPRRTPVSRLTPSPTEPASAEADYSPFTTHVRRAGVRSRWCRGGREGGRRGPGGWRGRGRRPQRRVPRTRSNGCSRRWPGGRSPIPSRRCQLSSVLAPLRRASNHEAGSTRSAVSSGARPRCSAASRTRVSRASTRAPSPSPAGSAGARPSRRLSITAHESSESWVHERRLRLSEPTASHTSSTTQTLACT